MAMKGRNKTGRVEASEPGHADRTGTLYLVTGEDEYRIQAHARELVDRLCPPAEQALGLEVMDGRVDDAAEGARALRRCLDALWTRGFLAGRKVVWLRDAVFFAASAATSDELKAAVEELTRQVREGLPPGQVLVISAVKTDRRSAFYKAFQAAGDVAEFEMPDRGYQVEQYAQQQALQLLKEAGLRAGEDALDILLDLTGTDTRQIAQEIQKLDLYLGGERDVQLQDVLEVVSPSRESKAWDLADAVGRRNLPAALRRLRQLTSQNENPMGLIIGLENRFRELRVFRELLDRGWVRLAGDKKWRKLEWKSGPELEEKLAGLPQDPRKLNPYRAVVLAEQAMNFTKAELLRGQQRLVRTHEAMVSTAVPAALQLELLLLRLLACAPRSHGAPDPV